MNDDIKLDLKGMHRPGRYAVTKNGYVFDRALFRSFSLLVVLILLVTFFKLGGVGKQFAYASCPADAIGGQCDNPLYGLCDELACQQEFLFPGEVIGEKPPSLMVPLFFIFLFGWITVVINHFSQAKKEYVEARHERNNNTRTK